MFTGDILFIGGTPIVWAGPLATGSTACDLILGMDVETVVPGHGPVTDKAGVAQVRDYLASCEVEATARHDAGMTDLGGGPRHRPRRVRRLGRAGRIAVNVATVYRSIDPELPCPDVVEMFRRMAALER